MNRDEFLRAVRTEKIFPERFSLDVDRDEKYVVINRGEHWVVYYSERGLESFPHEFASESEALAYLLTLLRGDA
jgi:hypothetical protein